MAHAPLVMYSQDALPAGAAGPVLHSIGIHRSTLQLEMAVGCPFSDIESPLVTPVPGDPARRRAPDHFLEATALQVLELSVGVGVGSTLSGVLVDLPLINAAACF